MLTCFSVAVNWRPVSIDVHGLDVDRVGSIGDQVVKERILDVPWNQNLSRKEPHQYLKFAYILLSRTTAGFTEVQGSENVSYNITSHLKRVGISFRLLSKHNQVNGLLGKQFLLRRDSEVPQMTPRTTSNRLQSLGFLIRPRFLLAVTSWETFPSDGLLVLSE